MPAPEKRRRPHPSDRFAGSERALDLSASLKALRIEGSTAANGHRQIALLHHGPVRLVLFAFEAGGHLPQHKAPGWITIHVLRGLLHVRTPDATHDLGPGQILSLAPGVLHDVDAEQASDMLLGVYPETPMGSAAAP